MVTCIEQKDLEQKQKQRKKDENYINHKATNRGDTITYMYVRRGGRECANYQHDQNKMAVNLS